MRARALAQGRTTSAIVLGLVLLGCASLASIAAPSAALAGECANEHVREESNLNAEGRPYSTLLPDCRAYEMVSPLEKQGRDAEEGETGTIILPIAVSPDGEAAGWASEGAFAGIENFAILGSPENWYRSRRGGSGWTTSSAFGPRKLVNEAFTSPFDGDSSPDLTSYHATCGTNTAGPGQGEIGRASIACARSVEEGEWKASPSYRAINGISLGAGSQNYLGGSSDLSRLFVQPTGTGPLQGELGNGLPLAANPPGSQGIYELAGIGSSSPTLRLVNVGNPPPGAEPGQPGEELVINGGEGPLLGDQRPEPKAFGGASHAISESGRTVFFTATPPGSAILTIYARRQCAPGSSPNCTEDGRGTGEFFETVPVSDGSECSKCAKPEPVRKPAYFMGASADGSKVFFMTEQRLLSKEAFPTRNLYEYNFKGPPGNKLVLLSAEAAPVSGVMAASADGSHVYFVSVLPGKTNLYGYDTVTGEPKLVATANSAGPGVFGFEQTNANTSKPSVVGPYQEAGGARPAQVTPDGRDLVFSSSAPLLGHEPEHEATAVYRYDFPTGELTWVSHAAPGFVTPAGQEKSAVIAAQPGAHFQLVGPNADIEDWGRAISGLRTAEAGGEYIDEHDGEYIIFTTATQLQANDLNGARDVYEWHCPGNVDCAEKGEVSLISDGLDPTGVQLRGVHVAENAQTSIAMSATGSDIFFSTHTRLVGQDTDSLRDVYDARIGGGFPAPSEPACSGEACQGPLGKTTSFAPQASANFAPGPPSKAVEERHTGNSKPPTLTAAQRLAAALKACKAKRRSKRASCESQARHRYAAQLRAQALLACKRKPKSERVRCEANARKRYRT